jgi:glycosyltransferase involved in cell wall biosynthesis
MKKIAIVTDAWHPQINGVVTSLGHTVKNLEKLGYQIEIINPSQFRTISCPSYPEISLALTTPAAMYRKLAAFGPHSIHIATEGPLGWAARAVCLRQKFPFTTSYHTRFPEYLRLRLPVPLSFSYSVMRRFHHPASRVMVSTPALREELQNRGFSNVVLWSRGVDTAVFQTGPKDFLDAPRPIFLSMGRVAVEKNLESFLSLDLPGTKYVVGDGPVRDELSRKYPEVKFVGFRQGAELASYVAASDVFVFPSLTDTFGVVLLEAMACGVPVAAFPVSGPESVVINGLNGYLDHDLRLAALKALSVPADSCRSFAKQASWETCSRQFVDNLVFQQIPLSENKAHQFLTKNELIPHPPSVV